MVLTYEAIAKRIDHALLLPTMTDQEMREGCKLAALYGVATVCIKPHAVKLAVESLRGSTVGVGTVVGFPHGGQSTALKVAETIEAMETGADEIDMVVNIGKVIGGSWNVVEDEIGRINDQIRQRDKLLKVIFETCYLDHDQKIELCKICGRVGVGYVKTSTGFGTGGATESDLRLMREFTPATTKLKASGGIRDLKTAMKFAGLGSERLGLSRTAEILGELCHQLGIPSREVSRETTLLDENQNDQY